MAIILKDKRGAASTYMVNLEVFRSPNWPEIPDEDVVVTNGAIPMVPDEAQRDNEIDSIF